MLASIRKAKDEKDQGFTLIELLVVIIIIGILAAIAIPTFLNQRNKGYDAQAKSDLRNAQIEVETFFTDGEVYPATGKVVPAPATGTQPADTVWYKKSESTGNVDYTATTTTYCAEVTSQSNKVFSVSEVSAGVVDSACP